MKKNKRNILVLIITIFIILVYVLKDDFNDIINILLNVNLLYLGLAFVVLIISDIFKSLNIYIYAKKFNPKYKFKEAYKLNFITHFFNGITPFLSGGQAYQIYHLNKMNNISYTKGSIFAFQTFFVYQTALVIITTIAIFINKFYDILPLDLFLKKIVFIGYSINLFVAIIITLINFEKKGKRFIINKLFRFLNRIKLIKSVTADKVDNYVGGFNKSVQQIEGNNLLLLKGIIFNVIATLLNFSIPLIILYAIEPNLNISVLAVFIAMGYIFMVSTFVPIPGGTGGFEFGFLTFFGFIIGGPILKAAMLLWRFVTYYIVLIIGSIVFLVDRKE